MQSECLTLPHNSVNMGAMINEKETQDEGQEPKFYELGYHIIPTVPQETIMDEAAKIREMIEVKNGVVAVDHTPVLRDLAYTLSKVFNNKKTLFKSAYFGFITFTMGAEEVVLLKESLDAHENILRFIIIKTTEDLKPTAPSKKMVFITKKDEAPKLVKKEDRGGYRTVYMHP